MAQSDAREAIDLAALRGWVGRQQEAVDVLTPRIADSLRATLDVEGLVLDAIPASVHWCLAPPIVGQSGLAVEGHPERGGFLPPVPLPRRMWAGSELEFSGDFALMDVVTRRSRIDNVEHKQGRSGSLVFVTVAHDWTTARGPTLHEKQTIVYRPAGGSTPAAPKAQSEARPTAHRLEVDASEILLFRYSALTFNSHRIHYDRRYTVDVEGYAGLLVHGPLQAAFLLEFAMQVHGGKRPHRFSFRGLEPLIDGQRFSLNANENGDALDLWCADAKGAVTLQARAEWA